jgi:uncharacterized protein (DUF433 family)
VSSLNRADLQRKIEELATKPPAIVERSPDVMGGLLVFCDTRVPVTALLDYLDAGDSVDTFLNDFPSVRRDQVIALLELV